MSDNLLKIIYQSYEKGLFPMAESREDESISLIEPHTRALLPIKDFHISRSLKTRLNKTDYDITHDMAFNQVIHECAKPAQGRDGTWINSTIENLFAEYHKQGLAHSVEFWQDGSLKGGVYGLSVGGVFCAESMFSHIPNASKIALTYLVARLWKAKYKLLDVQFINPHLEQFGVHEIPQKEYLKKLDVYKNENPDFDITCNERDLLREYLENRSSE